MCLLGDPTLRLSRFLVLVNHTGDVISYDEGVYGYRNKDDYPYSNAAGEVFDDRDYAGGDTFPDLDAATSFPYEPTFSDPSDATRKQPDFLNDRTLYHNRGNSTFPGENSLYGDFFGLDDLFTEHPAVVDGMADNTKALADLTDSQLRLVHEHRGTVRARTGTLAEKGKAPAHLAKLNQELAKLRATAAQLERQTSQLAAIDNRMNV